MSNEKITLRYTKQSHAAFAPTRGSEKAAGLDLRSPYQMVVPARGRILCPTDIKLSIPPGHYGRIAPRSGLAWHHGIDIGGGVIDEDYRGIISVVIFNHTDNDYEIKEGEKIAQLICEKISYPEVEEVSALSATVRGEGGFGSTGRT